MVVCCSPETGSCRKGSLDKSWALCHSDSKPTDPCIMGMGCNIFQVVYKVHVAERGPLPRSSFPWFQDMFRSCVMEAASNTTCWFKGYTAPLWDCNSEEVAQLVVTRLSPIGRLHCVRMLGMGHALRPLSLYLSLSLSLCLFTHDFLGWLEILQIWSRMN